MIVPIVVHFHDALMLRHLQQTERANDHVANALRSRGLSSTRICMAQARAHQSLRRGIEFNEAIRRAVAWARCADGPDLPPAA